MLECSDSRALVSEQWDRKAFTGSSGDHKFDNNMTAISGWVGGITLALLSIIGTLANRVCLWAQIPNGAFLGVYYATLCEAAWSEVQKVQWLAWHVYEEACACPRFPGW